MYKIRQHDEKGGGEGRDEQHEFFVYFKWILNGLTYTCDGTGAIINKSYGGGSFEGRG